jgi:hypothetical protein
LLIFILIYLDNRIVKDYILFIAYRKDKMTKKLKAEYQPGGSKRHVILDKAVQYLKDPRFGLQGDKQRFLMDQLGLSQSEYLTCLNNAAGGDYWQ